ncbi:Predicted amidohydrolase [Marinospirillum celere]|uniref:Predicted amidohydrolase n=1 Tax=Marinospirillum celere TaxID=1122252 RepID=A0A1I1DRT5_9GAMM|nr:carbon-nitrogen hydrolase family protein [Marinospirillum celere]SFB77554.1 Predicted amidohydrolase [Marinospirillum celere]
MRLALAQETPPVSVDAALERLEQLCFQANQAGADLLLTPEMSLTGYQLRLDELQDWSETPLLGPLTNRASELAKKYHLAVVVGYPERSSYLYPYNSALLLSNEGEPLLNYRKTHLFGELDRCRFQAGEQLMKPINLHGWSVNLAICYDVEFPEVVRSLALKATQLLLVPTANMHPYTSIPLRQIPVRAEENGICLAYANYTGREGQLEFCGLSCVCDSCGKDLGRLNALPDLLIVDLDTEQLLNSRHATYLADRRPELYD